MPFSLASSQQTSRRGKLGLAGIKLQVAGGARLLLPARGGDDHPSSESGGETICRHVLVHSRRKPGSKSSPCSLHTDSSREPI